MVLVTQFFVLVLLLVSVSGQPKLNDPCILAHGAPGRCIHLAECPKIAKLAAKYPFYERDLLTLRAVIHACKSDENSSNPIVCCGIEPSTQRTTPRPPKVPVTTQSTATFTTPGIPIEKILPTDCGRTQIKPLAYGGVPDEDNIHVWSVFLDIKRSTSNGRCAGTLIHERAVLTAAHCVHTLEPDNIKLYFGLVLRSELQQCLTDGVCQERQAAQIMYHPEYNSHSQLNDVALIRLGEPVNFTNDVRPACLPLDYQIDESSANDTRVLSFGWGEYEDGLVSDSKRIVLLQVIDQKKCEDHLRRRSRFNISMSYSVICTVGFQPGQDVCAGDSGSSLLHIRENKYHVVGVVSFGPKCGMNTSDANVSTRVSEYRNWILTNLKQIHEE